MTEPRIINLPKINDPRGNLSIIEENQDIPFSIKRCYWIYDVPGGEERGGHAYYQLEEFIVALSGSFDVVLSDGKNTQQFSLNRSYYGLYVPAKTWRHLENFSTNALSLHASDSSFDETDYIREFEEYERLYEK